MYVFIYVMLLRDFDGRALNSQTLEVTMETGRSLQQASNSTVTDTLLLFSLLSGKFSP